MVSGRNVATTASVALALQESFPYVRTFTWTPTSSSPNYHFLPRMSPIENASAEELAQRMGPDAVQDFLAWGPKQDAVQQFRIVLDNEVPIAQIIARDSTVPALQDDRPTNEYFFFRRVSQPDQLRKITRQMLGWDRLY